MFIREWLIHDDVDVQIHVHDHGSAVRAKNEFRDKNYLGSLPRCARRWRSALASRFAPQSEARSLGGVDAIIPASPAYRQEGRAWIHFSHPCPDPKSHA